MACNCGRPVRYSIFKNGVEKLSCNKRVICPTYEELTKDLNRTKAILALYTKTINRIDDYFGYADEHPKARRQIHRLLDDLTDKIIGM